MKKIKRTITMRKVEFTATKIQHNHDSHIEFCPLCHSPIHAIKSASDSTVETTAVESPVKQIGESIEKSGENKIYQTNNREKI